MGKMPYRIPCFVFRRQAQEDDWRALRNSQLAVITYTVIETRAAYLQTGEQEIRQSLGRNPSGVVCCTSNTVYCRIMSITTTTCCVDDMWLAAFASTNC